MKILVTGGAGYIGSVLCPALLHKNHQVTVLDNLTFGAQGILGCFLNKNFELIKGDILNKELVAKAVFGADAVIHLAAIVGYPACRRDEDLAYRVNVIGTRNIIDALRPEQKVIYSSTGSNYGALVGNLCTEETPLNPLTCYGRTKTEAERLLLDNANTVAFRFATAFGTSPRFRLDLMINDFIYQALHAKNLVVYEKTFKRTFIHVNDMVQAFLFALENMDKMVGQVYNVGSEDMNFTKEYVALKVKEMLEKEGKNFYLHFAEIAKDEDQRNYEVSYKKLNSLGYGTTISLDDGIRELVKSVGAIQIKNPYSNAHI
ncbi:MAG: NAD(P)-dependent oxidoreductase [Patescibacteria group bacterium]